MKIMPKVAKLIAITFLGVFVGLLTLGNSVFAENDTEKMKRITDEIEKYSKTVQELQVKADTLSNQIKQFDANITLTELKIDQTQSKIALLGGRIDQLTSSLQDLSEAFESRVLETYRLSRVGSTPILLMSSRDVNEALMRYYYLQKIQEADHELIDKLKNAQTTYQEQKDSLVLLEDELAGQQKVLSAQKTAKSSLLEVTKNDEQKYQQLLAAARAEFESIQAIIAGRGTESPGGHVNAGDKIANVIQGPSCNSNGGHLHFIVSRNGEALNPFSHLSSNVEHQNCSGSGECSPGDSFAPSGSWPWPINSPIKFTQGFGSTWAVANTWVGRIYQFHNGIDVVNESNLAVKAVQPGDIYQGSFSGSAGCRLKYVRVDHDNSDLETFYLHINY